MKTLRRLTLMMLVVMLMLLPMATSAHASQFDAVQSFTNYLLQYYGW